MKQKALELLYYGRLCHNQHICCQIGLVNGKASKSLNLQLINCPFFFQPSLQLPVVLKLLFDGHGGREELVDKHTVLRQHLFSQSLQPLTVGLPQPCQLGAQSSDLHDQALGVLPHEHQPLLPGLAGHPVCKVLVVLHILGGVAEFKRLIYACDVRRRLIQ